MKTPLLGALLLLASTGVHPAGASGVNLGWLDCPGQGAYQLTRTFACDTNEGGGHTLVGSFVAPPGMVAVTGYSARIEMITSGETLSPWWEVRESSPAGCRAESMVYSADFTAGPFGCYDYWQGGAIGGTSVEYPTFAANRARLKVQAALALGDIRIGPIPEGIEVYAFKLTINNEKTVGPGSCGGCLDEACIVFNAMLVTQAPQAPNIYLANPASSAHVVWQAWTTTDPVFRCPQTTPARNRTWGSIKAMHR